MAGRGSCYKAVPKCQQDLSWVQLVGGTGRTVAACWWVFTICLLSFSHPGGLVDYHIN